MGENRRTRRAVGFSAACAALASTMLLLAGAMTAPSASADVAEGSAKPAPAAGGAACVIDVKGSVTAHERCEIEYVTYPPSDARPLPEQTIVRVVGHAPAVTFEVSFFGEPHMGPQVMWGIESGAQRTCHADLRVEQGGQRWEALSHAERDFHVNVTSVRATCNDGGLKCWEIHGHAHASVPSAVLAPFAEPLAVSVTF